MSRGSSTAPWSAAGAVTTTQNSIPATPHDRPEHPGCLHPGRPAALDLRHRRGLPPRQRRIARLRRPGRDRYPQLDRRQRLPRPRHDHSHQKTTPPRTSGLGEGVQHRHQQNPLENRTNNREPEDLENPPHRLPPTTRNLHGHHQRRHRATILPGRLNKPLCLLSGSW
jgi:hypothetical protein